MRFDLSAVIIIALFVYIGHRRGLLLTAVGFISSLISIAIAFLMVRPLSQWLYKLGLFSHSMEDLTHSVQVGVDAGSSNLSPVLEGLGMPENWARKILQSPELTGQSAVDQAVNSVWQLMLGAIVLVAVFVLVRVGFGLLARLLTPVLNGVPVIGWLNRTGGFFLGLLWGIFTIWMLIMVLTSFSITSPLVRDFMSNSHILAYLSEKDIFRSLLDTIF